MLNYTTIYDVQQVRRRIKRGRYGGYYGNDHSLDGDRLYEFTMAPAAREASRQNLDCLLAMAGEYEQDLLVLKPYTVQIAGLAGSDQHEQIARRVFPKEWLAEHTQWLGANSPHGAQVDRADPGAMLAYYSYRGCLCLNEHQGVYDVKTEKRLTNRREIIQRMWDLGFAASRGRPLALARTRWTGSRAELELITRLADQHWNRQYQSEAAKKMVSTFRSINRYAAWPGAW